MQTRCYLCGCNTFNIFDVKNQVDTSKTCLNSRLQSVQLIPSSPATANSEVSHVDLSWHSIITLTSDAELYISGFHGGKDHKDKLIESNVDCFDRLWDSVLFISKNGKLLVKHGDTSIPVEVELAANNKLVQISCTDEDTYILTDEGSVKRCSHSENCWSVNDMDLDFKVAQIACGKEHTLLLSESGQVYSCGSGSRGQLGHGEIDVTVQSSPKLVEDLDGVRMKQVAAGGWHSVALSEIGDVYIWGWNESGQLGFTNDLSSEAVNFLLQPTLLNIDGEESIQKVVCGSRHTVALTG
ncbi:uncharacterized protein LOC141900313 isoform X2 [Tubulanus polymorphus]|uniref:uncharacterized protein LOC141900313 isoform X2 n=1 Tax=Tubulanus polymorphus TaxID=672921 RepID=UPI003DA518A3